MPKKYAIQSKTDSPRQNLQLDILKAFANYKHVLLRGPYGIGKTAFAKTLVRQLKQPMLYVSMKDGPMEMAQSILECLRAHKPGAHLSVRTFIGIKNQLKLFRKTGHIVIVDDVFRLTRPKIGFLNFLIQNGFKLLVIAESGIDQDSLDSLKTVFRVQFSPELPRMTLEETLELLKSHLSEGEVASREPRLIEVANLLQGYPLMIIRHGKELFNLETE